MPREVRDAIAAIRFPVNREQARNTKTVWEVRWRDPVWKLGFVPPNTVRFGYRPVATASGEQFPFRLGDVVATDRFSDQAARRFLTNERDPGAFARMLLLTKTQIPPTDVPTKTGP